ncbi:unnamed protein product [Auanema sp. JU1783]|nr:unnamed protein product [Auanema sp. JU1783]
MELIEALPIQEMQQINSNLLSNDDNSDPENTLSNVTSSPANGAVPTDSAEVHKIFAEIVEAMVPNISASSVPEKEFHVEETKTVFKTELMNETEDGEYIEEENDTFENPEDSKLKIHTTTTTAAPSNTFLTDEQNNDKDVEKAEKNLSESADVEDDMQQFYDSLSYDDKQRLECIINLFITLFSFQFKFPEEVKETEPDNFIIGIQCLFFDCRKALPVIPTKPSLIDKEPSWPIRRARAGGHSCW